MKSLASIGLSGMVLAGFAAITTLAIGSTYLITKEQIEFEVRLAEARQLLEIFPSDSHDNELVDDTFSIAADTPLLGLRENLRGYRARKGNQIIGIILPITARDGYSGDIRALVGIRRDNSVAGVRIVSHRETPGLGDKVDLRKSNWVLDFNDRSLLNPPISAWTVTKDGGIFDQFTGATITPRAVVVATRKALEYAALHSEELFKEKASPL